MSEPSDHAANRGFFEDFLRRIPGFKGYFEREDRRQSDRIARDHLADRLQQCKKPLDELSLALTRLGRLNLLPEIDRVRGRIDKLIGRIRGAMQGYSGFFDYVQVDADRLTEVYRHDMELVQGAEGLRQSFARLREQADEAPARLRDLLGELDKLDEKWNQRDELLRGWDNPWSPPPA